MFYFDKGLKIFARKREKGLSNLANSPVFLGSISLFLNASAEDRETRESETLRATSVSLFLNAAEDGETRESETLRVTSVSLFLNASAGEGGVLSGLWPAGLKNRGILRPKKTELFQNRLLYIS